MAARWEFLKSNASIQVLVAMWVLRYNLQWPWEGWCHGLRTEDWRYRLMAKNLGLEDSRGVVYWLVVSLLGAHLVPTLLVWFVLAPVAWRFPSLWQLFGGREGLDGHRGAGAVAAGRSGGAHEPLRNHAPVHFGAYAQRAFDSLYCQG